MGHTERRHVVLWLFGLALVVGVLAAPSLALARTSAHRVHRHGRMHHMLRPSVKPGPSLAPVVAARPQPGAHRTASGVGLPSASKMPLSNRGLGANRAVAPGAKRAHKPAPALLPRIGTVRRAAASAAPEAGRAESNGHVHLAGVTTGGPLLVPRGNGAHARTAVPFTPSEFYSSTQLDNFSAQCGFGVNETTIAQSSVNPNLVVAGANTYYDNSGSCQDSHAGVYYSSDGGQHWRFEVMPGLLFPSSGDPQVTYDPVRQVFLYAFVEFNRSDSTQGRIGVEASSDGVNWSRNVTLDSSSSSYEVDKPSITVDQNPGSPHYGRVVVAWTQFHGANAVYQEDYTDDGGVNWHNANASINYTTHECGNGTSPAFDANGDLMVAWADCTGGVNSIYEELSTDGGATWTAPSDTQITTTNPIESAGDDSSSGCLLDNGGSAFRCNSFPTLAGDPNSGDAGGTAFVVGWADERSTTQNSQTATVSQIMGLSTVDGTTWGDLAYLNFNDFGDKFFPAASFSPSGRLTVSYSSREQDATSGNPNGLQFNEHQTEASSLTNLRADAYVSYTTDGTLGNPGSLSFIGDYSGNSSFDNNFDTFPIWTDLRNGFPSARTQDLCYADCMTPLSSDDPIGVSRAAGSTFSDFYSLSMDPSTGSGSDYWNLVALRPASSTVDDDTFLSSNRYFNTSLASSAYGAGAVDYTVINGNTGHAPNGSYFPQVHSFSSNGGSYTVEWDAGNNVLGGSIADSMGGGDVGRVYDSSLTSGTTYYFGVRPDSGNSTLYDLALHSASDGSEQGRGGAVTSSAGSGAGAPAFISYATGSDPTQFDGVTVVNANGGSGSYTLYRDTSAPSGTVSIDGGAASTNNTTLNLTLSATNPTSGDPVSEMAFSVNGGAYTAFQPYATSASVTVPAGEGVQTVAVEYRNGAGAVSAPAGDTIYLEQSAPTITGVSPNSGPTAGGNTVTLAGTHFAPGATVKFGSVAGTSVTFVSSTQITVKAPAQAVGTHNVIITTTGGTSSLSSADLYTYVAQPTITSLSPNSGPTAGGNTVTITGTQFAAGATVKFGSVAGTSVTVVSSTKITVKAPAQPAGTHNVIVTTAGGPSALTSADLYTYIAQPTITSLSPSNGPTAGGNTVTITGTQFAPGATVKFGSVAGTSVTVVSSTQITVKAPAQAAGGHNVIVTTAGGSSAISSADVYTYLGNPTITGLSPSSGPTAGGNTVTITGTQFAAGATVKFGSVAGTSVTVVSSTHITVKAPAQAAGTHNVIVTTAGGTSALTSADVYRYV